VRRVLRPEAFFAAASLAFAVTPASAGMLRCQSKTIVEGDFNKMKHAATRTAKAHKLDWSRPYVCMNPGRGRVWVDAFPETQGDGTILRPSALCTRDTGPWKCEINSNRVFRETLSIEGKSQPFEVFVPPTWAVDDIRKFVVRGFTAARELTSEQYCGGSGSPIQPDWAANVQKDLRDAVALRDEPIGGSIYDRPNATELVIGDISLQFSLHPPEVERKVLECWAIQIIVT
jgi:hypothetical protein